MTLFLRSNRNTLLAFTILPLLQASLHSLHFHYSYGDYISYLSQWLKLYQSQSAIIYITAMFIDL